jgi:CheY-like chemotaxis protein
MAAARRLSGYLTSLMGTSSAPTTNARVLIVDDDPEWREALRLVFSADDSACELAASAPAALDLLAQGDFDAVVCDVRMDGMDGLELLDHVKKIKPALPVVMITGEQVGGSINGPYTVTLSFAPAMQTRAGAAKRDRGS